MEEKVSSNLRIVETFSYEDTYRLGQQLATQAVPGQVICLTGDLGTGKTVFTQGFACGLGVTDYVDSPTFTIVKEYHDGRMPFYHFDVYRIGDVSEMDEIGYEEYFYGDGVCIVEWGLMIEELLPDDCIFIEITKNTEKGFDYRRVSIKEGR
ncbi:MAG TPA: tRNA (adenosine(37)-N6)-threonylcarbamoyltransferase complex ATPase subunit type 1 TsaE [Eubacterium sp.]|jgi:hydrolase, P-loop family|nr:tRNA (adenosine(37)-N6)-threonylcarbamoyltransferase complex ATPase subunit type 1 TsaE [Eubacterium sp.]HAZ86260.1 tRNA (adenosine(37)-N6)-threonylcarbamoyltransferase complex ATPase subunit type 1 TsaE [Eubacterium sp.]